MRTPNAGLVEVFQELSIEEIDAADCWLTYQGAQTWKACSQSLEYWSKYLKKRPIKITAHNLALH